MIIWKHFPHLFSPTSSMSTPIVALESNSKLNVSTWMERRRRRRYGTPCRHLRLLPRYRSRCLLSLNSRHRFGPIRLLRKWDMNPLNLFEDLAAFKELKEKEIKNESLAMVAWLVFYIQVAVTGKGLVQNLLDHLVDPFYNNLLSIFSKPCKRFSFLCLYIIESN